MDRLEAIRRWVDDILRQQPDVDEGRAGFVHLYGVSAACILLAFKRGLDPQLAALAGMLHDIWTYKTGILYDEHHLHGARSAELAGPVLRGLGLDDDAIAALAEAMARHPDKATLDDSPLAELLKDADTLQHYLYNPWLEQPPGREARLNRIFAELGLPAPAVLERRRSG
jgi:HD superfamily phosphodiesterase